jgi:phosphomannomutase
MSKLMVGVSGVRGIVGEALTTEVAGQFARAFATVLGQGRKVALGRDTRPSGPQLRDAIVDGLTAGGVDVVDLGVVSTPGVALMIKRLAADGGVVITASHNPSPYNGIKFMTPEGLNLPAGQAHHLKEVWQAGDFADAARPGTVSENHETHQAHVEAVCGILDVPAIRARRYKVVLDSINGAGCAAGRILMDRLGVELIHVNGEPTGDFAHEPEPKAENLTGLCEAVAECGADVGFAQDPDADRLAIVDEAGRYIGEEYTLALTAAFVLTQRRGDIATNLATSRLMDDVAEAAGVTLYRSPTGEANVAEAMGRHGCLFGGEGGGGAIDPRVVTVRDSFVAMGLMLNAMAAGGRTVSQLVEQLPRYTMLKDKFPCPDEHAGPILAAVRDELAGRPGARVNEEDGLRVDLPEGWVQIRTSNTEPIMRITAEAADESAARDLAEQVRRIADRIVGT